MSDQNFRHRKHTSVHSKKEDVPQNSGFIKNTDLWSFLWFQSWHLMGRSRLQAICNMTWGAWYSSALHPTNESAEVSEDQPAHTDPPLLPSARGKEALCPGRNEILHRLLAKGKQNAADTCRSAPYLRLKYLRCRLARAEGVCTRLPCLVCAALAGTE